PPLEEDAAQPAPQEGRLHSRRTWHEDALAEGGRGAHGLDALPVDVDELARSAEPLEVGDRAGPVVAFSRERVHAQVPLRHEVGVDTVPRAPLADAPHDLVASLRDAEPF